MVKGCQTHKDFKLRRWSTVTVTVTTTTTTWTWTCTGKSCHSPSSRNHEVWSYPIPGSDWLRTSSGWESYTKIHSPPWGWAPENYQTNMDVEKTVGFRSHQLGKNVLPNITTVLGPAPTEMRFVSTALEVIWAAPNVDHTLIGHPHQGQPQVPGSMTLGRGPWPRSSLVTEKASHWSGKQPFKIGPRLKYKWNYNSPIKWPKIPG